MINPGEVDTGMKDLWEVKMPLKIKVFLWMLWHDRVQTGEQLKIRKRKHSEFCKYCRRLETRDHCNTLGVILYSFLLKHFMSIILVCTCLYYKV